MLACNALSGASSGNSTVDSTNSSSKVCTLRCNIETLQLVRKTLHLYSRRSTWPVQELPASRSKRRQVENDKTILE